jgi:serine/threonine protein kinase
MIQNRYLIVQSIGKGGMGDVYLAIDQRLGSAVALKRTFFSEDSELGTAFEREARILARLRHPVLPKVIDHFADNNDQFLVMEHISGDDLSKRLENSNKSFPLTWVMFWADQLLDALSYLHTHEPPIIHRDIKPQNLKLTDENHIVLLDFGLSKDFDSSKPGDGMNSASVAGYSPHFAAMEQIRGTGTDGRSDLYSLSATLYQLMSNEIPCDALSRADALLGGKEDPIIPLSKVNPEVPEAVSNVILKGIALRQEERFATAAEMQRTLRRAYNRGEVAAEIPVEQTAPAKQVNAPATAAPAAVADATPNFDATLKMDDAGRVPEMGQGDLKTAIMPQADLAGEGNSKAGTAAVPPPAQELPHFAAAGASAGQGEISVATRTASAAKKTSSSKAGLVVAGLFGLLVVGALAAGGGWYVLNNFSTSAEPQPTPTVQATTPEPVRASDPEANVDPPAGVTDANSAPASDSLPANVESSPSPAPIGSKPSAGTKPAPQRTEKPPAQKDPVKPKPRDDRTVILQ